MVRYKSEFRSLRNILYRIEIVDTLHTGSVSTFVCGGDGFSLEYRASESENLFAPLLNSELSIFAKSQDSNFDRFLQDIYESAEDRFFVKVFKENVLFWCGSLLLDVSGMTDEYYPQTVTLRATDGLNRLKSVDFVSNNGGAPHIGTDTVKGLFYRCLSKVRTVETAAFWSNTDKYFQHNVNWKDVNHGTGDVLENIRIPFKSFNEYDKDGNFEPISYYDVLVYLCESFGCRLALIGGVWELRQINEYTETASMMYPFQFDGVALASSSANVESIEGTHIKRKAAQGFDWLPALQSVKQCFTHNTTGNLLNGFDIQLSNGLQTIGTVSAGNGGHLLFSGRLVVTYSGNSNPPAFFLVRIRMIFKIGNYFLIRDANSRIESDDYDSLSWNNSPTGAHRFEFVTEVLEGVTGQTEFNFSIRTPDIVSTGSLSIDLQKVSVLENGTGTNLSSNITVDAYLKNTRLEYADNDEASDTRCFMVQNGANSQSFSDTIKYDNSVFGDALVPMTPRAIEVYNGTDWVQSSGWRVGGAGTALAFTERLLTERLAAQTKNVLLRTGNFIDLASVYTVNQIVRINHHTGSTIENRWFVAIRATLNANADEWSGAWWNVKTDRTNIISTLDDKLVLGSRFVPSNTLSTLSVNISQWESSTG